MAPVGVAQDISMRFLIVDDSSTMRRIIINTLNELGHQDVQEAGNGKEGLDGLTSGRVDMIIAVAAEAVARLHQVRRADAIRAGHRRRLQGAAPGNRCPADAPVAACRKRSSIRCASTMIRMRARTTRVRPQWPTSPTGWGTATASAARPMEQNLFEDPVCARVGLNDAWLADLDRRAPGLFQVARQIAA